METLLCRFADVVEGGEDAPFSEFLYSLHTLGEEWMHAGELLPTEATLDEELSTLEGILEPLRERASANFRIDEQPYEWTCEALATLGAGPAHSDVPPLPPRFRSFLTKYLQSPSTSWDALSAVMLLAPPSSSSILLTPHGSLEQCWVEIRSGSAEDGEKEKELSVSPASSQEHGARKGLYVFQSSLHPSTTSAASSVSSVSSIPPSPPSAAAGIYPPAGACIINATPVTETTEQNASVTLKPVSQEEQKRLCFQATRFGPAASPSTALSPRRLRGCLFELCLERLLQTNGEQAFSDLQKENLLRLCFVGFHRNLDLRHSTEYLRLLAETNQLFPASHFLNQLRVFVAEELGSAEGELMSAPHQQQQPSASNCGYAAVLLDEIEEEIRVLDEIHPTSSKSLRALEVSKIILTYAADRVNSSNYTVIFGLARTMQELGRGYYDTLARLDTLLLLVLRSPLLRARSPSSPCTSTAASSPHEFLLDAPRAERVKSAAEALKHHLHSSAPAMAPPVPTPPRKKQKAMTRIGPSVRPHPLPDLNALPHRAPPSLLLASPREDRRSSEGSNGRDAMPGSPL